LRLGVAGRWCGLGFDLVDDVGAGFRRGIGDGGRGVAGVGRRRGVGLGVGGDRCGGNGWLLAGVSLACCGLCCGSGGRCCCVGG
jgi:hypothetical protein